MPMNTTVKKFLDAIRRLQGPKDKEIRTEEMYQLYTKFCQQNGLTPRPIHSFWQEVKAACPNLDLKRESYTLNELQAAIMWVNGGENKLLKLPESLQELKQELKKDGRRDILKAFLEDIKNSDEPRYKELDPLDFYERYVSFCEQKGKKSWTLEYSDFWEELSALCPNWGTPERRYTFGELQAIIIIDTHENPVVSWYVSTLRAQIEDRRRPRPLDVHDVFLSFYSWLYEAHLPKDKIIRCSKLYDLYSNFCKKRKYNQKYNPIEFWKHTRKEFPQIDYEKTFTFGEFCAILAQNPNILPF